MEDNYLQSLIGKGVQIHRGGPDSNTGKLLDVTDDYVALQKDDGEIIYFKTSHIKSIRENPMIKFNSLLNVDESLFIKATTFQEMASQLKEQNVRINGVGPESKVGKLIDIRDDFVIIFTEDDGLIFYKDQHIKSLSTPIETTESSNESGEKEEEPVQDQVVKEMVEAEPKVDPELENLLNLSEASNLNDVLTNLKYSWVKINRKGPESVEGLLVDSNDQQLVLAVDNEILRISTYHVKNISVTSKKSKEETEKSEENSSGKAKEKNSKQDDSNEETNEQNSNDKDSENLSEAQQLFEERLAVVARKRNRRSRKKALQNRKK